MDKQEPHIEEMNLSERVKKGDALKAAYQFEVNELVDAKDSAYNWLVAQILKLEKCFASITFDGWLSKWNEEQKSLTKLAPFRYYTKGYTGQKRCSDRAYMAYSIQFIDRESTILDEVSKNIMALSPRAMTQYLRGRLYIVADFLMETDYGDRLDDLPKVFALLRKILLFTIKYVNGLAEKCSYIGEGTKYKSLYLFDPRVAYAMSWYEIIEVQRLFFFQCPRILAFYAV